MEDSPQLPLEEISGELKAQRPILILLIEDRLNDAKIFQKILATASDAGRYWLIHAKRLSSALTMLQKERVDVVVLDLSLPDSEGLGSIDLLRNSAPTVPIVVLTGAEEPNVSEASIRFGAQEFISKNQMNGEILSNSLRNAIERHKHRAKLIKQLERDQLALEVDSETQLPSEGIFKIRLSFALEQAHRESKIVGLMLVKINDFILDGSSAPEGLRSSAWGFLSSKIINSLRKNDSVGRLNSNTLAILCYDLNDLPDVHRLASKISHLLATPFEFEKDHLKVSFNMGVALSPFDESLADGLLASAERALDSSILLGRNQYAFASKLLNVKVTEKTQQLEKIKDALIKGSFELRASKIQTTGDGELVGFRLNLVASDPDLSGLSSAEIFELCDLVGGRQEIIKWMIHQASNLVSDSEGSHSLVLPLHIALPPTYLFHKSLVTTISATLSGRGVDPARFVIEIPEDVAWSRPERASRLFEEISQSGLFFSFENLGVGQASLRQLVHLRRYNLRSVGLSPDLVRDSLRGADRLKFVEVLTNIAHQLGYKVASKGIQDSAVLEHLRELGVDYVEGAAVSSEQPLETWMRPANSDSVGISI